MDFIYDTNAEDVMVAVDLRDYKGLITPQFADSAVLLTYPDSLVWIFGAAEEPMYYSYVKRFETYDDYCSWVNQNTEIE
jgi:hypothetical protein